MHACILCSHFFSPMYQRKTKKSKMKAEATARKDDDLIPVSEAIGENDGLLRRLYN